MLFDSPIYFVFLTLVVLVYWQLDTRQKKLFLLAGSYFFYGWWDWRFLGLIALSTIVDFYCAHLIVRSDDAGTRRRWLIVSLALNLGFLGYFKYCGFFVDSLAHLLTGMGVENPNLPLLNILLPPGISFYTFQAVAYIVDVYDRRLKPADSLTDYALFISLFPHLIAGPIQRPDHLLPQVQTARRFDAEQFHNGVMLIVWGLFRKCVIADNCAMLADGAFSGKFGPPSIVVLAIGAYAFAWQIYGDFSGYSMIARGSANLLGYDFMVNFRQPYLATNLQDFWRRWHISLSTWLRDYLYIRLGGNRGTSIQTNRNLFLTMAIGGLWHGANWTYVVWGALHGVGLMIGRAIMPNSVAGARAASSWLQRYRLLGDTLGDWLKRLAVFHFVCLAWVFFRAANVQSAVEFLAGISVWHWRPQFAGALILLAMFSLPLLAIDLLNERRQEEYPFEKAEHVWQVPSVAAVFAAIALVAGSGANAFIYFQF